MFVDLVGRSLTGITLVGFLALPFGGSAEEAIQPGAGSFSTAGGRILDPEGNEFLAAGINIYSTQMDELGSILSKFPRLNIIRLATNPQHDSQEHIQEFLNRATSRKIVVVVEDHSSPCCTTNTLSGQKLAAEEMWYARIAWANRSNPYVWFGTANEPDDRWSYLRIVEQEVGIYNAVRGAQNNSIVMLELRGGGRSDAMEQHAGSYQKMSNVVWDLHHYGLLDDGSYKTDCRAIHEELQSRIRDAQRVAYFPVIFGEYGISTDGSRIDPNARELLATIQNSGYGNIAWAWNAGADSMIDNSGNLNWYGQIVARYINGRDEYRTAGSRPARQLVRPVAGC